MKPVMAMVAALVALRAGFAQVNLPIDARALVPPWPAKAGGKLHLAYELQVTNFGQRDLKLMRLEVLAAERDNPPLARYEGSELDSIILRPGLPDAPDKRLLGGGAQAILFLWVTVNAPSDVPYLLRHRFTFVVSDDLGSGGETLKEIVLVGAEVKPNRGEPVTIGPPLRGQGWLALNGPSNISLHRRALIPIAGRARIAQRFAIDWVKVGPDGRTFSGDRLKNESYHAYGAHVLAVADAVVASVKDGIPENVPGLTSRAVPMTLENIAGNHVILDIGKGRYVLYAHLQPNQIRVSQGQKVRRGQVIGLVGNSGNSTEPHLHLQVCDASSPLESEGLPFAFESFEVLGGSIDKRSGEMPLQNELVRFPEATLELQVPPPEPRIKMGDVASADSIIAALYEVISGPAGLGRDWDRFRALFLPEARLIWISEGQTRSFNLERFIVEMGSSFELNGLFQREVARRVEGFGQALHVLSVCESRRNESDRLPFARGINSIHLISDGSRWWIAGLIWQPEQPKLPIPKKYLKGK
jgi:murein DD-endopeptidase MepM/ murein hydrolase activator NlpD